MQPFAFLHAELGRIDFRFFEATVEHGWVPFYDRIQ